MVRIALFLMVVLAGSSAFGAGDAKPNKQMNWPFDGVFGSVDRQSAQRGLQVYKEVCAACHGLRLVAFRNLEEIGFSKAEVKAFAADYTVVDGPDDEGEMFERPGRPSDQFVSPYPNKQAAQSANGGAYPVDLSLIVKARVDGANYLHSLLTGYDEEMPADFELNPGLYYNPYFAGGQLAMPSPLAEDLVTYEDGTAATVDQMSYDVVNFLQWAAEPEMERRKRMGIKVGIYLIIFTILFYFAKKRIWSRLKD